jgi:NADH-quinone oxidoreductase subunit J
MVLEPLVIGLIAALVLAAILTVAAARIMWSVIGLAVTSAILTALMFRFDAPLAAVFELSVCAGLIPAIFISTISMTRRVSAEGVAVRRREKRFRYAPLLILVPTLAAVLVVAGRLALDGVPVAAEPEKTGLVRQIFWNVRQIDLIGQISILLGGAFAIAALLKEQKRVK